MLARGSATSDPPMCAGWNRISESLHHNQKRTHFKTSATPSAGVLNLIGVDVNWKAGPLTYRSLLLFLPRSSAATMLANLRRLVSSEAISGIRYLSSSPSLAHGGLQDKDRIFTNIYGEHDIFINGAMKRGDWYRCATGPKQAHICCRCSALPVVHGHLHSLRVTEAVHVIGQRICF